MPLTPENGPPGQSFGSAGIMWLLATSKGPQTSKELAERAPVQAGSVNSALKRCYRKGFVARRRREEERGTHGNTPYEYTIRWPQGGGDGDE